MHGPVQHCKVTSHTAVEIIPLPKDWEAESLCIDVAVGVRSLAGLNVHYRGGHKSRGYIKHVVPKKHAEPSPCAKTCRNSLAAAWLRNGLVGTGATRS